MPTSQVPLLHTVNLQKTYEHSEVATQALAGVTLSINTGEFVAIMGPSGSGKSTLLHILGFLDRPTSGEYIFSGHAMAELTDQELATIRNKKMGFVFQAFHLLSRTSVLDNVLLPLQYSTVPKRERRARAEQALAEVGLTHRITHLPNQLSGGEKQRVAIARALVNDPLVIFADEPTGNLDSRTGAAVMEIIEKLHGQGHTVILITHETPTAQYAQRIVTLKDGTIITDEQVAQRRHSHYEK